MTGKTDAEFRVRTGCKSKVVMSLVFLPALLVAGLADTVWGECSAGSTSYWKLDEAGGPNYVDFVSGNDGACTGVCPTAVAAGKINGAQAFSRPGLTGVSAPGA